MAWKTNDLLGHIGCDDGRVGGLENGLLKLPAVTAGGSHDKGQAMPAIKGRIFVDRRGVGKINADKRPLRCFDVRDFLVPFSGHDQFDCRRSDVAVTNIDLRSRQRIGQHGKPLIGNGRSGDDFGDIAGQSVHHYFDRCHDVPPSGCVWV